MSSLVKPIMFPNPELLLQESVLRACEEASLDPNLIPNPEWNYAFRRVTLDNIEELTDYLVEFSI